MNYSNCVFIRIDPEQKKGRCLKKSVRISDACPKSGHKSWPNANFRPRSGRQNVCHGYFTRGWRFSLIDLTRP